MRCAHWRRVPPGLLREAWGRAASGCVDRVVRCQLALHDVGPHHGFLDDLAAYGTALWLRWDGADDVALVGVADCPVVAARPDGDACCLFAGHGGAHAWETLDVRRTPPDEGTPP